MQFPPHFLYTQRYVRMKLNGISLLPPLEYEIVCPHDCLVFVRKRIAIFPRVPSSTMSDCDDLQMLDPVKMTVY